jgi:hypothetical protein
MQLLLSSFEPFVTPEKPENRKRVTFKKLAELTGRKIHLKILMRFEG